jgi:hypothetical protein
MRRPTRAATTPLVDPAVTGACETTESRTPVLGVAVPYAVGNVPPTILGPLIVTLTFSG